MESGDSVLARRLKNICANCMVYGWKQATEKRVTLRCTGCKIFYYCGRECQMSGWNDHKKQCKEMQKEYVDVQLKQGNVTGKAKWKAVDGNDKPTGKAHFVVKVQVPLDAFEVVNPKNKKEPILVYNAENTINGFITSEMVAYQKALEAVKGHGLMGAKAYFYAIWEESKGLKINLNTIQAPEPW